MDKYSFQLSPLVWSMDCARSERIHFLYPDVASSSAAKEMESIYLYFVQAHRLRW